TPQRGDVGWIVLPVSIERRDPGCVGCPDACADRRTLPIILPVTQQPHLRRFGCEPRDLGDSRITAPVIHVEDLIFNQTVESGADLADERGDIFGLVLYWDND